MSNAAGIETYTNTVSNKRISAVVAKMESNMAMAKMFVGVVFVIIAFLYMIFTKQTMDQECSVLGTLMALGIKKRDILFSYMIPPCLVTFVGRLHFRSQGTLSASGEQSGELLQYPEEQSESGYKDIADCNLCAPCSDRRDQCDWNWEKACNKTIEVD